MLAAWVDGVAGSDLPISDRALHYGDAIFTTLRVHAAQACWLQAHLQRLQQAADALRMPMFDWSAVHADIERAAAHPQAGVVKVILSRGDGARGYAIDGSIGRRLVVVYGRPATDPAIHARGVALRIADLVLSDQPALAGLKHGNRLEQILARSECVDPGIYDVLLADARGHVISATSANLFARFGDEVRTPLLSRAGVAGVARSRILQQLAGTAVVTEIALDSLYLADELFLSNCVRGIVPVRSLGDHRYTGMATAQALMRSLHTSLGLPIP
jgi:4-amino-4-deoxychorismate lyase